MQEVLFLALIILAVYHFKYRADIQGRRDSAAKFSVRDGANQLHFVSAAQFSKKHIMNKGEYKVFCQVEGLLRSLGGGYRVFAQTCLGEVIGSDHQKAFESINSKRVDILVIDWAGHAVAAIEYQGEGHFQGQAVVRDAVKKEALRKAGVSYVEVYPDESEDEVKHKVRRALGVAEVAAS